MTKEAIVKSPSGRPTRTPVGRRNVLTVNGQEPGFVYRVVNEDEDRIERFKEAGWELVSNSDVTVGDKRVNQTSSVGSAAQVSVGGGMKGYVMRIKQEWYDEDQRAKQREIDEKERLIRKGPSGVADYGSITIDQK